MHPTGPGPSQELRALEHLNVFGDGLERHVERSGELGHRMLFGRNPAQDRTPHGVGQRMKNVVQVVGFRLNHLVECIYGRARRLSTFLLNVGRGLSGGSDARCAERALLGVVGPAT
jgi:hypothetical protein